ncbi:glycosyltransferase family 4 protein [Simiduia agarivorans]|uniref:Glycosyl transferase family protein n=1 Tax=Simiduia agarivorans (strain DSM 21679 / JCM 13881 / BCRC 17597 / SA1) TaxID=1117647 RepID=K4L1D5_SIMAS|nr:glycosyltransferase family 4 protein [Simiduia agarivorans]AFU99987.1 glycosyl transferase family protein [Simiduia agarivorans SA1 = DSM 21679]
MNALTQVLDQHARPLAADGKPALRICLLGYRSHPFVGGQGIYLHYLSKALLAYGHQVDVISGPPYPELVDGVRLIKMPSLDLFSVEEPFKALKLSHLKSYTDTFEWWSKITGGFAEPYTFGRRVAKYLKRHGHQYDLVHDNQCLAWGLLDIQNRGLPVVATVHHPITRDLELKLAAEDNWGMRLLIKRWHSFLKMQKKVVQQLDHVVTVSEQSRADIAQCFDRASDRIDLIHNGIDTHVFKPDPQAIKKPFSLITTASADQPLKGLRYLLEAMHQLRPHYPDISLTVIGKLHAGGETEQRLKALSLTDAVEFVSGISTEALVARYNAAEIAVVPSLYEGFGLPAGEAMACGLPLVATDGGAIPEVVGDAALSVPAGDANALAQAISQLIDKPAWRQMLAEKARARIESTFSWQKVAEQLTHYYRNNVVAPAPEAQRAHG